jgi:iron complex transport system ATP-binding protein
MSHPTPNEGLHPTVSAATPILRGDDLSLSYEERLVSEHLNVEIPEGKVTIIIGPNACGKSTMLRALSRLLAPKQGHVYLDGKDAHRLPAKEFARRLGLLPQQSNAPYGITVGDLTARGRYPHQNLLQQWTVDDEAAVERALRATDLLDLVDRPVDELSGGQRQRVWISLLLAQDPPVMLLDEPTTYLDIANQLEVLELCQRRRAARAHARGTVRRQPHRDALGRDRRARPGPRGADGTPARGRVRHHLAHHRRPGIEAAPRDSD